MRRLQLFGVILLAAAALLSRPAPASAGGGGGGPCTGFGSGDRMVLRDNCFDSVAYSAQPGVDLVVTNEGSQPHTFTAIDGSFDTGRLRPGQTAHVRLGQAAIVRVYCTIHGTASGQGMAGIIIIGEPGLAPAAAPGLSLEARGAIDQQSGLLESEIEARTAGQTRVETQLAAVQQQVAALQNWRLAAGAGLLGLLLGAAALAAVVFRRTHAGVAHLAAERPESRPA